MSGDVGNGFRLFPPQASSGATEVDQLPAFYPAEDYHQDYATLHPSSPYIAFNDLPKVDNLHRVFPDRYRDKPVLVFAANQTN